MPKMREARLSLNKLSKRYPLTCRRKFSLSISALFLTFSFYRLTVWWSSDLCNQRERGVEPLGTKLRNTLFSLFVPLSNRWRFIFNMLLLFVISFLFCTVARALQPISRLFTTFWQYPNKGAPRSTQSGDCAALKAGNSKPCERQTFRMPLYRPLLRERCLRIFYPYYVSSS
jgi:hypothetical protein